MSELSLAYIFHQHQLLVDENFQLPRVESLASDLYFHAGDQVIARDLREDEAIPQGLQLVPIRQFNGQAGCPGANGFNLRLKAQVYPAFGNFPGGVSADIGVESAQE